MALNEKDMFALVKKRYWSTTIAGLPNAIIAPSVPLHHQSGISIADGVVIETHRTNDMRKYFPLSSDAQFPIHAFEIKTQRGDWLREKATNGTKSKPWRSRAHYFWLVIPDTSIAHIDEVPEEWGVLVGTKRLRCLRPARLNTAPEHLSWETQLMISRCALKEALNNDS